MCADIIQYNYVNACITMLIFVYIRTLHILYAYLTVMYNYKVITHGSYLCINMPHTCVHTHINI